MNTVSHLAPWVIAGLQDQQVTALPDPVVAITARLEAYNGEPFQKRPGTRVSVFESEKKLLLTAQGLDSALIVLRFSRRFSATRLEAAGALAGRVRAPRYAHLEPLLATGQEKTASLRLSAEQEPEEHGGFVRGADHYAGGGTQ